MTARGRQALSGQPPPERRDSREASRSSLGHKREPIRKCTSAEQKRRVQTTEDVNVIEIFIQERARVCNPK